MGLEIVTKGRFQMPYGLKLPDMLARKSLERILIPIQALYNSF